MSQYTVTYERGDRNWSASLPDLPGCIATGTTRRDVQQQIGAAIAFHIEGFRLHGEAVPAPGVEAGTVNVSVE